MSTIFKRKRTKVRAKLLVLCEQQDHKCFYCKYPILPYWKFTKKGVAIQCVCPPPGWDFATFDHKVAASLGGTGEIENGVASCMTCNSLKGDTSFEAWCGHTTARNYKTNVHRLRLKRLNKVYSRHAKKQFKGQKTNVIYVQFSDKRNCAIMSLAA